MNPRPLEGIVVADFTAMVSGASCTRLLADCGATVIKIESAEGGGDLMRHAGDRMAGISSYFALYNAGKKGVVLNLKSPAGLDIAKRLIKRADIMAENFRPGVMARLGLDYAAAKAINPQIIYCSISGFGQEGPLADRAAYAPVAHAFSGFDMVLGRASDPEGPPAPNNVMVADVLSGAYGFAAIQTALVHRLRHGVGSYVDVTLAGSMMTLIGMQIQTAQAQNTLHAGVSFPPYRTRDGYVNIPLVSIATFRQAYKVLGKQEWLDNPEFNTLGAIAPHRPTIIAAVAEWTAQRTTAEVDAAMTAAGVPCAVYHTPAEVYAHPHVRARGAFSPVRTEEGEFEVLNAPFSVSDTRVDALPFVPKLGGDTRDVLRDVLGCSEAEIDALAAQKAIA
ncbi:MAG: CaiB/BaiF CoA transferase family protein [Hyphomonadaceae bacterium]